MAGAGRFPATSHFQPWATGLRLRSPVHTYIDGKAVVSAGSLSPTTNIRDDNDYLNVDEEGIEIHE